LTFNILPRMLMLIGNICGDPRAGARRRSPRLREHAMPDKSDVLQGTLDLMVLKTLDALGSLHGYGIARRIEQVSEHALALNQGTLYPALVRLEQRGWIRSSWGVTDSNRRARFYSLTRAGRRQLLAETENWRQTSRIMARFLEADQS